MLYAGGKCSPGGVFGIALANFGRYYILRK